MNSKSDDRPALSLTPAPRQKLAETVVHQILDEISRRQLRAGTRMPSERELQQLLGVGRSTVREAMTGLAAHGVVEIRHGEGTFVLHDPAVFGATDGIANALSKGVTRVLLEARRPVETEIARLAALRRTESDLRSLRSIINEHQAVLSAGRPAARQSAQFHVVLSEAAHNEVLAGFVSSYQKLLIERGPQLEQVTGYRRWELEGHRSLLVAVEAGDPDLAAGCMREHLDGVVDYYARLGWPL